MRTERIAKLEAARAVQAPPSVHSALKTPGKPLDTAARMFFEQRFDHDFGKVRVHADSQAAESARAVDAQAFTVGRHVVFDRSRFDLSSHSGLQLVAHELSHTVQQEQREPGSGEIELGAVADASEREAARAASSIQCGGPAPVSVTRPISLQRQPNSPPAEAKNEPGAGPAADLMAPVVVDSFLTGKSNVSAENQATLLKSTSKLQELLKKYPGSHVRVTGHTDAVGKEDMNLALGQSRADAVKAVLVAAGIPAEAIVTESKGETDLLVQTEKPESKNRRAEVQFDPAPAAGLSGPPSDAPVAEPKKKIQGLPPLAQSTLDKYTPDILKLPSEPQGPLPPYAPKAPDWMKPIPPDPRKPGGSLDDKINDLAGKITSFLPDAIRDKAQDLVKGAIEKGITSTLDAGLKDIGVDEKGRKAIGTAVEAAMKQKPGGN